MDQRRALVHRLFRVDDVRQRLVLDHDLLAGVLGQRAGLGDHRGDLFAGVARHADGERKARDHGAFDARHQRVDRRVQFLAGQHVDDARHRQRGRGVDRDDARGRMLRGTSATCSRPSARRRRRSGRAGDEAPVLDHAPVLPDEAEGRGRRSRAPPFGASAHAVLRTPSDRSVLPGDRVGGRMPLGVALLAGCVPRRVGASFDRVDDLAVAGAAANVAADRVEDLVLVGLRRSC